MSSFSLTAGYSEDFFVLYFYIFLGLFSIYQKKGDNSSNVLQGIDERCAVQALSSSGCVLCCVDRMELQGTVIVVGDLGRGLVMVDFVLVR